MHASHPGTPTKAVYVNCPVCHTGRMIHKGNGAYYCPDCSHSTQHAVVTHVGGVPGTKNADDPFFNDGSPCFGGPKQDMVGGMAHSVGTPPFHLIPTIAWQELANQYALGEKYKGKDAWNAFSLNQHVLKSKEAIAVRLGHVISHAVVMLEALAADKPMDVRDAAAIMWGGSFAICAAKAQTEPDR